MHSEEVLKSPPRARAETWRLRAWRMLGTACVAIGVANAFIPLLPTTVFLLLGAWAWGKGAPEWRARLLAHPRYGPPLQLWLERRMITRRGKRMCLLGLAASWLISSWLLSFRPWPSVLLGAGLLVLGLWIGSRAEPQAPARR